jgi:predicted lipid-binding transport protein (Tim44 family)
MARAGGGQGKSGGIWGIILWPFFAAYAAIISYYASKKNAECKRLLERIAKADTAWDPDQLKAKIEKVYFAVQRGWRDRNQEYAKQYMSHRLYEKHQAQIEDMIRQGRQNVMEDINLSEAKIVEVMDYRDDSKDAFWVLICGSMVDYTVNEQTKEVVSGEKKNLSFKELWKFKRENKDWVLDEIDQNVSIGDLKNMASFSE